MSWVRVQTLHAHARNAGTITIGIRADSRRDVKSGRVFADVRIGPDAAAAFGWKQGTKLDVAWGEDEHAGFMRLEASKAGRYALRRKGKSAHESFTIQPVVPAWIKTPSVSEPCGEVERDGAAMILPLPPRFAEQYRNHEIPRERSGTAREAPSTVSGRHRPNGESEADERRDEVRLSSPHTPSEEVHPAQVGQVTMAKPETDNRAEAGRGDSLGTPEARPAAILDHIGDAAGMVAKPLDTDLFIAELDEFLEAHGIEALVDVLHQYGVDDEQDWKTIAGEKRPDILNDLRALHPVLAEIARAERTKAKAPEFPTIEALRKAVKAYLGSPAQGRVIAARHGGDCAANVPEANRAAFIAELAADKPETWTAPTRERKPIDAPRWMRAEETFPKVMMMIEEAIAARQTAPTGIQIAKALGFTNDAQASLLVGAMETAGLVKCERINHKGVRRVITICATGAKTFDPRTGDGPGNGASKGPAREFRTDSPAPASNSGVGNTDTIGTAKGICAADTPSQALALAEAGVVSALLKAPTREEVAPLLNGALAVLLRMARLFPGEPALANVDLAEAMEIDARYVAPILSELQARGLITVSRDQGKRWIEVVERAASARTDRVTA